MDATRKVIANKCFMGVHGISAAGGVTSSYLQEVAVNRSMLAQCSGPKIVVADSSKIGVCQNFLDYSLDQITHLITDSNADKWELEQLRAKGVESLLRIYGKKSQKEIAHVFHLNCHSELADKCNDAECAFFRAHMV